MNNREQATRLEISTIQPIPLDQRHGTAADLFICDKSSVGLEIVLRR